MRRYETISVDKRVKRILENDKGDLSWSEYLLKLYRVARRAKAMEAFNGLRSMLSEEDLNNILKSSKEFRRRFKLG